MRPRKAELEAVVALLDEPADDVESLARAVLMLAWDMLQARDRVGVVLDQPGVAVTLHGPFESRTQADRFLKAFTYAGPARPRVLVAPMTGSLPASDMDRMVDNV